MGVDGNNADKDGSPPGLDAGYRAPSPRFYEHFVRCISYEVESFGRHIYNQGMHVNLPNLLVAKNETQIKPATTVDSPSPAAAEVAEAQHDAKELNVVRRISRTKSGCEELNEEPEQTNASLGCGAPNDTEVSKQEPNTDPEWYWPNGDIAFEIPQKESWPYFGYAFNIYDTYRKKNGNVQPCYYCLGVYKCGYEGCQFLARPMQPHRKKKYVPPLSPTCVCPYHPDVLL